MMLCDDARPLVGLDLDGTLPDEARARLAGHLISCPGCSAYREEIRAVSARLDAACLPLREEAAAIVAGMPGRRPGQETVPVRPPWRALWGVLAALILLGIIALVAAAAT